MIRKGKLGPGEMLAIDLRQGQLLNNLQIHNMLKERAPYRKWLKQGVRYLDSELVDSHTAAEPMNEVTLARYQKMFNMSREELREIVTKFSPARNISLPVPSAFLDQYVARMAPGTAVSISCTQRRDQYDSREQELGACKSP